MEPTTAIPGRLGRPTSLPALALLLLTLIGSTSACAQAASAASKPHPPVEAPARVHPSPPQTLDLAAVISPTANPMVALYTLPYFEGATWSVQFGPTTAYGLTTNVVSNHPITKSIYVAGMTANTLYHMRATVTLPLGGIVYDVDHTFTTGPLPAGLVPALTASTTPGLTPQPGIELFDTVISPTASTALATDLAGNVIWTYLFPDRQPTSLLYPIKFLPNGHFMMEISPVSQSLLAGPPPAGSLAVLREIDLAGNIVRSLSIDQLNQRLTRAGFYGLNLQLYSHDFTMLPNGHILAITNTSRSFTDLPGYPGVTNVAGDVIVDLDKNLQPVWVWNEFDHLDINRHPWQFPDWTHTNSILYAPDDGSFMLSVRHQNWVVKVNYRDGQGDGSILWKLGPQGDFALQGGDEPVDWFYSSHALAFFSPSTAGVFSLALVDNGNDRQFPDGTSCPVNLGPHCYTTVPVFQIDERARTATITSRINPPRVDFSPIAGNVELLGNGNTEYTLSGASPGSMTFEVTPGPNPETVWQMFLPGSYTYREFRLPSLYPGVQW